jgi:hypothetical protein
MGNASLCCPPHDTIVKSRTDGWAVLLGVTDFLIRNTRVAWYVAGIHR